MCDCFECRKRRGPRAVAPYLAARYDDEQALIPLRREERERILHLERLVAHRELQLSRAGTMRASRRAGRWVAERSRKLAEARGALERSRKRLARLA